ncbi:MAG: NAD(P)/FAD-dependent oxidoreductase [Acidobacteria bacterium]|nr:NAD(P)/FAD-dependent oxidoreductase [Acidobacteriota bacterium]
MSKEGRRKFDVVVIGGGPAGMAAAFHAARSGAHVAIIDDNPALGGQIWRGETANSASDAAMWLERLLFAGVDIVSSTRVVDQLDGRVLLAETARGFCEIEYRNLVVATGARERFLPFPGWTLRNVLGAGALAGLVKSGLAVSGKRVVVAGSGPLLLQVASDLVKHGAQIAIICEQASRTSLAMFALRLAAHPSKVAQAMLLRRELKGVRFAPRSWPVAAEGDGILESVVLSRSGIHERIRCDYLACGFHLVPNTELAVLLGCRLENGSVAVDNFQRTSVANIFAAGEPTGIGGVELALVEGQIAGLRAAGAGEDAHSLISARRKLGKFRDALERAFRLRPELKEVASPTTIVCRCEDVTWEQLKPYRSSRAAKLQTRCGMGPCQARVCGAASEFLFGWKPDSIRPPVFPTTLENLAALAEEKADSESSALMRGGS